MENSFDIKGHRVRLSLTQAALADRLGRAPNTVARWERGELPVPQDVRQTIEAWTTGPTARLPVPDVVTIDSFHSDIVAALDGHLDPAVFELCAGALLRSEWPQLVPVSGGGDEGFDGAVPAEEGKRPWPLIVTTARDVARNLRRSLKEALRKGHQPQCAIFATSRALTPGQRTKLQTEAGVLGVTLQQIYDRSWFADSLYRHSEWCSRLLNLTGTPEPLSKLPVWLRATGAHEMLGRSTELARARETEADVILLGSPGSGKTMLLQRLADEGYFLSGTDAGTVANSIRRHSPKLIFVDDAHDNFPQLEMLVKLRRQLGRSFRIVASAWPPYRAEVREYLPNAEDVSLLELDADIVAEIVRSIVPGLPNPAIREIVRQADGRPGLAATLAQLCIDGRYRDVMTGDALYANLRAYAAEDSVLLGCFALAGDVGFSLEDVAIFLGRAKDDVQRTLTRLAAGGVIRVSGNKRFSVWPPQLRYVLVREVFFHQHSALEYEVLLAKTSSRVEPLQVLLGATRSGAQVQGLQFKLEEVNQVELWTQYAWLDPASAGYVLAKHPEVVVDAAPAFLWHVPDRAVPKLLDLLDQQLSSGSLRGPAESALRRWLRGSSMDQRVLINRSDEAARQALKWTRRSENAVAAVVAFCIAMSPNCESSENDPGRGMTFTIRHGALDEWGVGRLTALWKEVAKDLLVASRFVPWSTVFDLLHDWIHPSAIIPVSADTARAMKDGARVMVLDLASLSAGHPGAQRRLAEMAKTLGLSLDIGNSDSVADVAVLFPSIDWDSQESFEKVTKREVDKARKWARARIDAQDVGTIVKAALSLRRQLDEAKTRFNNYSWAAFDEIARGSSVPTQWIDALVAEDAEPALVWPFVQRIVERGARVEELLEHLKQTRYRALLAEAALASKDAQIDVVAWALDNAVEYVDSIAGQIRVGNVDDDRVLELLAHDDERVRAAVAIACFTREKKPTGDVGNAWRRAVIDTARIADPPSQAEYWLRQMLLQNFELASEWLKEFLQVEHDDYSILQLGLEIAGRLSVEAKEALLRSVNFTARHTEFLAHLVDGDPKLYEVLLQRDDLAPHHLAPLNPRSRICDDFSGPSAPRHGWPELSAMALDRNLAEDDVFEAILPHAWGYAGSEVPLWQGWCEAFAKFESHPEPAVRRIALRGKKYMEQRVDDARERERMTAVRGI